MAPPAPPMMVVGEVGAIASQANMLAVRQSVVQAFK
jgi:hypothetical protein